MLRAVAWWSTLDRDLRAAWQRPHVPVLALPATDGPVTLGRSRDCDCVLAEPSVSRRHAELRRDGKDILARTAMVQGTPWLLVLRLRRGARPTDVLATIQDASTDVPIV